MSAHTKPSPRKAGFHKALTKFFTVFNGSVSQQERLVHYCKGIQCCRSPSETRQKMIVAILGLVLRRIPGTPSATKWTKLGPCLDCMLLGQLHGLLAMLFRTALGKLPFVTDVQSDVKNKDDIDPEAQSELTWHQVAGSRYQKATRLVRSEVDNESLRITAVTMEPIRFLTRWFLRCSREHHAPKIPYLCSAVNPEFSPVTTSSQHFTALLFGSASRLRVIFGMRGCQSFLDWARAYPGSADLLRRAVLVGVSGIRKRHAKPLESWPWRLASLVDPRVPDTTKTTVATEFMSAKACCLPFGFARRLQARIGSVGGLLSPGFKAAMWGLGRVVQMTVAGIENRHARSRRRRTPDTAWHNFVVRYINEEAKTLQVMREIRQLHERAQVQHKVLDQANFETLFSYGGQWPVSSAWLVVIIIAIIIVIIIIIIIIVIIVIIIIIIVVVVVIIIVIIIHHYHHRHHRHSHHDHRHHHQV